MTDRPKNSARPDYLRPVGDQDPPPEERLLPYDLGAERAVQSAALLSADALDQALDLLRPEHFFTEPHQHIWTAIGIVASKGPVDITLVAGVLRDRGLLMAVGGASYLAELVDATPAIQHVRLHAERVLDLARLRAMVSVCMRVSVEGRGDVGNVKEFVAGAVEAVESAGSVGARTQASAVGDVIGPAMAAAKKQYEAPGRVTGLATGLTGFDDETGGLHRGEVMLTMGRSGGGKSSLSRQFGLHIASTLTPTTPDPKGPHIQEVVYFGVADSMTEEQITMALACTVAEVPSTLLRTKMMEPEQWSALYQAANWISKIPLIVHHDPKMTVAGMRAELRLWRSKLAKRGWWCEQCGKRCPARLALVVADTVQVFGTNEPSEGKNDTNFDKLDRVGRGLLKIAEDFDASVIAISQLNKEGGAFGGPTLKNHVQTVVHVKTSKKPSQHDPNRVSASLVIEKQRHGPEGTVSAWFEKHLTRFVE